MSTSTFIVSGQVSVMCGIEIDVQRNVKKLPMKVFPKKTCLASYQTLFARNVFVTHTYLRQSCQ
jgi:hypothetical protein